MADDTPTPESADTAPDSSSSSVADDSLTEIDTATLDGFVKQLFGNSETAAAEFGENFATHAVQPGEHLMKKNLGHEQNPFPEQGEFGGYVALSALLDLLDQDDFGRLLAKTLVQSQETARYLRGIFNLTVPLLNKSHEIARHHKELLELLDSPDCTTELLQAHAKLAADLVHQLWHLQASLPAMMFETPDVPRLFVRDESEKVIEVMITK